MLIKNIIERSELHKRVVRFFHENPAAIDTLRGISTWVRAEDKAVKKVLSDLIQIGILDSLDVSSTTAYSYTHDMSIVNKIGRILSDEKNISS